MTEHWIDGICQISEPWVDGKNLKEAEKRIEQALSDKLETLDLSGLFLEKIPENVSKLTWLKHLNIGRKGTWQEIDALGEMGCESNTNFIDEPSLKILSALPRLESLDLSSNRITDKTIVPIVKTLRNLKKLVLWNTEVYCEGLVAIGHFLPNLIELDLSGNSHCQEPETAEELKAFIKTHNPLHYPILGDEAALIIAQKLPKLKMLRFASNLLTDTGLTFLAQHLSDLKELDLTCNLLTSSTGKILAEYCSNIETLDLSENNVGDEGAIALFESLSNIINLDLSFARLGLKSATVLASSSLTTLKSLNLETNDFGVEGIKAIMSGDFIGLECLNLCDVSNKFHVADELFEVFRKTRLKNLIKLDVSGNMIGKQHFSTLKEIFPNIPNEDLWL